CCTTLPPRLTLFPYTTLFRSIGYDASYLSKAENGQPPTADLARACDQALQAGGQLIALAGAEGMARPAQLPAAVATFVGRAVERSEEHTSELQSRVDLVCRLL